MSDPWACGKSRLKNWPMLTLTNALSGVKEQEKFDTMTSSYGCWPTWIVNRLWRTKRRVDELTRFPCRRYPRWPWPNKRLRVIRDFKNDQIDILAATDVVCGLDISGVTRLQLRWSLPRSRKLCSLYRTYRTWYNQVNRLLSAPNEMGHLGSSKLGFKKRMKGLKPPTAQEASRLRRKRLKKIERDFAGMKLSVLTLTSSRALRLNCSRIHTWRMALYILSLTVQDPETMPGKWKSHVKTIAIQTVVALCKAQKPWQPRSR